MQNQFSLFQPEQISKPVQPDGSTITDPNLYESFFFGGRQFKTLNGSKVTSPEVEIQIAQHTDGLWMWACKASMGTRYSGYQIGPKWGKFAATRSEAILLACSELRELASSASKWASREKCMAWIAKLEAENFC